ncbi:MAG: phage tail spike protein [Methanosphaera sp.]|nr:phage tail spike protein [Methanosphaera sp.]
MIKLFGINDKLFSSNGDIVLQPLKAEITKEDNGNFYLDIEVPLSYIDDFTQNRIIVAPTPQGNQAFRIGNVKKTNTKLKAKCNHVYYDSANYLIEDSYVVDKNCNDALDHLNNATDNLSPFTTISDVVSINSYRCVRRSLEEAIEVVLERWGGHLVRDNFTIGIRENIGADNGVVIRYAKNLKDITCEENWDDVCTKLMPVGKDGLLLPEKYLTSQVQYSLPYTKKINFNQDIDETLYQDDDGNLIEEEYTQALINDLREQGNKYLLENQYPKVNYTLEANVEKITDIGDTIEVIDERLGINIMTNLISYEYDCILGKYTKLEFGNFQKKLSSLLDKVAETTEEAINEANSTLAITLGSELRKATDEIWSAMGDSYVIYDGDKILVVDSLPKETATNVIMINNGGIAFSQTGINGTFNSAWLIDGTLDMQNINVINLMADMIKGGTLKLGSQTNQSGTLELYNNDNILIGKMDKDGLKMFGSDGSYVIMNDDVGFAGYDSNDDLTFWADFDEFHMKKGVIEDEITLSSKLRFIPITITDDGVVVNDGIGLVALGGNE